jgi:hypothetical protein
VISVGSGHLANNSAGLPTSLVISRDIVRILVAHYYNSSRNEWLETYCELQTRDNSHDISRKSLS